MAYERKEPKKIYIGQNATPRLPIEYQEVEYIESSGTQYIDTTHQHTANSKVELKFNYQSMSTEWNLLFGSRQNYTSNTAFDLFVHNSDYIGYTCGGSDVTNFYSSSTDTDYTVSLSKSNITINGNSTAISTNLTSYGYNDWLLNFNEGGNPIGGCYPVKAKLYYCKIRESDTLVRDFVPCYRIADSVIGLYDLINDVFYTNSGTGTFSKGADVVDLYKDIKKVYLGSTQIRPTGWQPTANTVVYIPLDGDVVDYSTYNRSFTVYGSTASVGSPVFDTLTNGKKVANFIATDSYSSNWFAFTDNVTDIPSSGNMTLSFWVNVSSLDGRYAAMVDFRENNNYTWMTGLHDSNNRFLFHGVSQENTTFVPTVGTWYNMVCTVDNGTCYVYKDGTQIYSDSYTYNSPCLKLCLGCFYNSAMINAREETISAKLSEVIVEKVAWTAQEIIDYYDLTKGDYGIS